ncbi:ribosomal protein S16 (chloroplast) [Porphyra umbilicalis]|uniref:Ribosomal protein S16 n=1 Tax=Porphyra umbilicalis TaxID=2786 RepID=J7F7L4_PORUM|nr:ribosomal protein S16 [Porphyra umbilicalis]AFC40020.1 ribosomal protein S16 [Porphyra umbilicalis]ASN78824.1 ribosomal protein S16 [Porphyra umbilicalis]|eukprot:ASN78824.1 ribosomal protein S16 (chloroplast) [Porphyra umbilicalis]
MVKLRLKRYGRKQQPSYRIVAMDSRNKRDGKAIEELGFYNPITNETHIDSVKILKRLKHGAQATRTVQNILNKAQIVERKNSE